MIEKLDLKRSIDQTFREAGFTKKSGSWYRIGSDVVLVINLQKSDFGNHYYLNCGINLKALSDDLLPRINACHIQIRIDDLIGGDSSLLAKGLDLDEGSVEDLNELVLLIREKLLPMLPNLLSVSELRNCYRRATFKRALLFWEAREILEAAA
jgi:hypothetical protein